MVEIHKICELVSYVGERGSLEGIAIQGVNLESLPIDISSVSVQESFFIGCRMGQDLVLDLIQRGAYVIKDFPKLPFQPFRTRLYSGSELFDQFHPQDPCSYKECADAHIYRYWQESGGAEVRSIVHGLFQRMHDQSISDALYEFLSEQECRPVVAIMGGHSMKRTEQRYREVVELSRRMTADGYLMVSGGGPGAMEATHLGARLVGVDDGIMDECLRILGRAPSYQDKEWLAAAFEVMDLIDRTGGGSEGAVSLGIPTWHYGHEPPTPFATHIAKYFSNSLREEGLITIAHDGIVFAPGSAGTIQEIFQDAAQNHYETTGHASPMIFLDEDYWIREKPVYPLVEMLARGKRYHGIMGITDTVEGVIEFLGRHRKIAVESEGWNFLKVHCSDDSEL